MSPIILGPDSSHGLPSTSSLLATLPNGRQVLVLSGIAEPDWVVNDDGNLYYEQFEVHLGVYAAEMEPTAVTVGLASIANDDSTFTFALNDAAVSLDQETGEIVLTVNSAALGAHTAVSRFGYQVVTTIEPISGKITGEIGWPVSLWLPPTGNLQAITNQLQIIASVYVPPSGPGQFGSRSGVAAGTITSLNLQSKPWAFAEFEIDNVPLYKSLAVQVTPGPAFHPPAGQRLTLTQTSGPGVFTLTKSQSSVQLIFAIMAVIPPG